MFEVFANDYRITIQEIPLGNQGEDMARCLVIDITDAVLEFGSGGTISVRNKRNGDEMPYFATNVSTVTGADAEGNVHTYIKWTLTDVDTAVAGSGFVQADYVISGVTVKSWVYKYFILPSLGVTGDVPDPYEDILEEIEAQVSAVQTAAASAAASAAQASAEATRIISTTQEVVEDWLSDHIVTGYTVDDTLTISGAAADAKVTGDALRAAFVTEQTSGSVASFTDGADNVPLSELAVNITPAQSGTGDPSPTNIRPITGFDEAKIFKRNKNLLNVRVTSTQTINGITFTVNDDGTVVANGTATAAANLKFSSYQSISGFINAGFLGLIGQTVILTGCPEGGSGSTYEMSCARIGHVLGGSSLFATDYGNGSAAYVIDDFRNAVAEVYIRIHINSGVTCNNLVFKPMLRLANTDASFEPNDGQIYTVSFGDAGTIYGGTLDVTTGVLTVTNKRINDLGSLTSWQYYTAGTNPLFRVSIGGRKFGTDADGITGMCSMYKFYRNTTLSTLTTMLPDKNLGFQTTAAWIAIRDDSYTDVDSFKAAIAGQSLVYPLETPISYQLTPTEVNTLLGNNNIWADTGDITNLEYRADTRLYIEHLTTPDGDMVADSNITSGSYFMVGNSLYLATSAIAARATIIPGTNCTATNLAAALNAINS